MLAVDLDRISLEVRYYIDLEIGFRQELHTETL